MRSRCWLYNESNQIEIGMLLGLHWIDWGLLRARDASVETEDEAETETGTETEDAGYVEDAVVCGSGCPTV